MVPWYPGATAPVVPSGTQVLWYPSTVVPRCCCTQVLWYLMTGVPKYCGTMVPRCCSTNGTQWCPLVPFGTQGTVIPKFCGTHLLLYPSTVVSKACGAQKMWYHGTQWYGGTQVLQYLWYPVMPSGTTGAGVPSDTMVSKYCGTMYF